MSDMMHSSVSKTNFPKMLDHCISDVLYQFVPENNLGVEPEGCLLCDDS